MKLMGASNNLMLEALSALLTDGETLQTPFYGVIEKMGRKSHNLFCFIGMTESVLLAAILNTFDASRIDWAFRVDLDIKEVKVKKSFIPNQFIIKIEFNDGDVIRIRASTKLLIGDFDNQEINLTNFMERLSS